MDSKTNRTTNALKLYRPEETLMPPGLYVRYDDYEALADEADRMQARIRELEMKFYGDDRGFVLSGVSS